ncbi:MAG: cytochrome c [Gemmatimonadetes bacterium]|nr:cytochrome c [Gemmatimonadota bacterium]
MTIAKRRLTTLLGAALLLIGAAGCELRQAMYDKKKYEPLEASAFFADGMSFRAQVDGTVARGQLMLDEHFYQGKIQGQLAETLPVAVDRQLLERGQERYNIFCAPCHDQTGAGNGMIVQRGLKQPLTFHQQRLREVPVGHFYDVITNGFGVMYSYASRISVADRWAIVAYIKVLQLSQNLEFDQLPAEDQRQLQ